MRALPVQSAGRRLVQKFGFAFLWAAFFGGVFGGLVYYRSARVALEDAQPWYQVFRATLERAELWTFDWRVRELGKQSTRSDAVVVVGIDDEALASAREDTTHSLGGHPWPREVLGGLTEQLVREGGALVLFDLPFGDLSPRGCAAGPDDEQFRDRLDRLPQRSLMTFGWLRNPPTPPERELRPSLVFVENHVSFEEARENLRRILAARAPAYLIPDGKRLQLWAAAASEAKGKELADSLSLPSPRTFRQRLASEQDYEVTPWRLMASFAEVEVDGLDVRRLPQVRHLEPPVAPLLSDKSLFGANIVPADADGTIRGMPHLIHFVPHKGKGFVLPSAPLAAAMQLAGSRKLSWAAGRLSIGDRYSLPMDESGYSLVRWDAAETGRNAKGSLKRSMSAWKVLVNLWDHELKRGVAHHDNDLADRVAVVTDASSYATDARPTPIGPTAGAALMGQALVNILRSDGISRAAPEYDLLLTLSMALFGAVLAVSFSTVFKARAGPPTYFLSLAIVGGLYALAARYLFLTEQRWIAVAGPLAAVSTTFLAATGYASSLEHRFREFLTTALGRYVHPEVARRVESDIALMRPERRQVTIYVADVVGFTTLSSKLAPEQVVGLLHEYFTEATKRIAHRSGHLDKYLGDAVMAFWGAPVRLEEHAQAACEAALEVDSAIEKRGEELEKKYGQRIRLCAGLASGEVVAGDMGSDMKSNYSVVGEPIDVATRLEEASRKYGTRILVNDATFEAARGAFAFREVDRVRFAADGPVVRVHELMGRSKDLSADRAKLQVLYLEALTAYQARRFDEAGKGFRRCAAELRDPVSEIYAARCRYYAEKPPAKDWDGVYDGPPPPSAPPAALPAIAVGA